MDVVNNLNPRTIAKIKEMAKQCAAEWINDGQEAQDSSGDQNFEARTAAYVQNISNIRNQRSTENHLLCNAMGFLNVWKKMVLTEISSETNGLASDPDLVYSARFFFDPWELSRWRHEYAKNFTDNEFHGEDSKYYCLFDTPNTDTDALMFEAIKHDVMWIYDRCFSRRLWMASLSGDKAFFSSFAKALDEHIQADVTRGIGGKILLILSEFERTGLTRLTAVVPPGTLDEIDSKVSPEWEFAYRLMECLIHDIQELKTSTYFQGPKKFHDGFSKYFLISEEGRANVKYKFKNARRYNPFEARAELAKLAMSKPPI